MGRSTGLTYGVILAYGVEYHADEDSSALLLDFVIEAEGPEVSFLGTTHTVLSTVLPRQSHSVRHEGLQSPASPPGHGGGVTRGEPLVATISHYTVLSAVRFVSGTYRVYGSTDSTVLY